MRAFEYLLVNGDQLTIREETSYIYLLHPAWNQSYLFSFYLFMIYVVHFKSLLIYYYYYFVDSVILG